MCDHKYLIKNCKPACDLCPLEEMRLTCQGIRDAINDHLEDNMVLGRTFFDNVKAVRFSLLVCWALKDQAFDHFTRKRHHQYESQNAARKTRP